MRNVRVKSRNVNIFENNCNRRNDNRLFMNDCNKNREIDIRTELEGNNDIGLTDDSDMIDDRE